MREGSREPARGECGFVIEKTFRTRPDAKLLPRLNAPAAAAIQAFDYQQIGRSVHE